MTGLTRYGATRDDLAALLDGLPRYRVDQVWQGLYEQLAAPEELTALPKALRAELAEALPLALEVVTERTSDRGETVKWLWALRRRHAGRDGADALRRPVDGVRVEPGGLRDGLRVLRHRARPGSTGTSPPARSSSRWCGPGGGGAPARRRRARRRRHHLLHDLAGGEVAVEARPGRWRRSCSPSRSPPGSTRTPWTARRSASAPSRPAVPSRSRHSHFTVSPRSLVRSATSRAPSGSARRARPAAPSGGR